MFISRLTSRDGAFSKPERAHSIIMAGFGRVDNSKGHREYLFGVKPNGNEVVVQSVARPDWNSLRASGIESETKEFVLDGMANGDLVSFSVVANPTEKDGDGRERPILSSEGQGKWLQRISKACGFSIEEVSSETLAPVHVRNSTGKKVIQPVKFVGTLRVSDADRFKAGLMRGFGRSKCYGYGMMNIARA